MQNPQVLSRVVDTIFSAVKIRSVEPKSVEPSMTLGRGGLGLDSVDILEIVVAVEQEFGIRIQDKALGESVFKTIGTIAQYVEAQSPIYRIEGATGA